MAERPNGSPKLIQEKVSTRAIEALMSNYRDAQQAFLELIDNAVDNRTDDEPLLVRIRVTRNELSVFNEGGRGLDFEGLENFFVWGYSEKTSAQIGFYGVGGKAAMGFLGRSMEVSCSAKASDTEYKVVDPAWETREEGELKQFTPEEKKAASQKGYFRVKVTNLKREVNAQALAAKLGDIYAPLLRESKVKILVNGKEIEPLTLKFVEDTPSLKPQLARVQTRFGDWFDLKVGVLAEGQRVKPGIRCYYRGRLIEDEQFFGHPSPAIMPQASRLAGEAHLDFVPVTANKASFIHSSPQWDHAAKRVHDVLTPWIDKVAKLKMEQRTQVEGFEKELAKKAKRILEHIFATTGVDTKEMLPGESSGRKPPTPSGEPRLKPTGTRPHGAPQEGQTAPELSATIGEIKRWGAMFKWEIASMGSLGKRSDVVEENGHHVLKINADYPMYQAEKKAGGEALELYMAESGILKIAEIVAKGKSIEEYLDLVNTLLRDCGEVYQGRLRNQTTRRGRRR